VQVLSAALHTYPFPNNSASVFILLFLIVFSTLFSKFISPARPRASPSRQIGLGREEDDKEQTRQGVVVVNSPRRVCPRWRLGGRRPGPRRGGLDAASLLRVSEVDPRMMREPTNLKDILSQLRGENTQLSWTILFEPTGFISGSPCFEWRGRAHGTMR